MSINDNLIKKKIGNMKGYGIFVKKPIKKGELLIIDQGRILSAEQYLLISPKEKNLAYQIEEDKFLVPNDYNNIDDEWFVNHSCEPNTIFSNGKWFASKNLGIGEELTHDYVLLWMDNIEHFEINPCLCGSKNCRGKFNGKDWKRPELQEKYKGQFLPYMERKIFQRNNKNSSKYRIK
jgi:SET domain-containing protein